MKKSAFSRCFGFSALSVLLVFAASCVDEDYDLNKLDTEAVILKDITMPLGNLSPISVSYFLNVNNDESSFIKADANGDYSLSLEGEDLISRSYLVPTFRLSLEENRTQSRRITIELPESIAGRDISVIQQQWPDLYDKQISFKDINGVIASLTKVLEMKEDYVLPHYIADVKDIDMNSDLVYEFTPKLLNADGTATSPDGALYLSKGFTIDFPDWLTLKKNDDIDAYIIENKQDNKNVITFVKDYRIDLKQPAAFTLLVTRIDVPEGFLIDGGVDSEGRSYKKLHIDGYETRNMILIDGDTYVKPSDFTRVPYKAELDMVLSFRNIVAQSATLSLNVDESLPDMEINLPELPELLTGNGVVMDLYDPAMYMNFRNLSPLELNVYAHLYSYRNSQMLMDMHFGENGEDKPITVPRQFDGSIGVSRRGEGEMMANPGLGMFFRTIPDMVQIKDIRLIASRDYASIVAGQEVEFSFGYELDAPLAFGPDLAMDLEYELAGFQLSINDVNVKKAVLTLDAVNSIPLSLNVTAVVLDSEGMPVNDMEITVDNEIKAGSVQSPTESSVTLTLTSEAEYLNLDGLRLCFRATCPPECQGIVLNENQTLELKEIKICLPEGASVDVSDYIYAI